MNWILLFILFYLRSFSFICIVCTCIAAFWQLFNNKRISQSVWKVTALVTQLHWRLESRDASLGIRSIRWRFWTPSISLCDALPWDLNQEHINDQSGFVYCLHFGALLRMLIIMWFDSVIADIYVFAWITFPLDWLMYVRWLYEIINNSMLFGSDFLEWAFTTDSWSLSAHKSFQICIWHLLTISFGDTWRWDDGTFQN